MFVPPHKTFFLSKIPCSKSCVPINFFFFNLRKGKTFQNPHFKIKQGQIIGARTKVMILPTYIKTTRKTNSEPTSSLKQNV